jgi:molybdopterin-binding protein
MTLRAPGSHRSPAIPCWPRVEIQAGPHRFVSLLSREAADELGLEPGMLAAAAVKATNISVEIPKNS